jgi:hypothetical protein
MNIRMPLAEDGLRVARRGGAMRTVGIVLGPELGQRLGLGLHGGRVRRASGSRGRWIPLRCGGGLIVPRPAEAPQRHEINAHELRGFQMLTRDALPPLDLTGHRGLPPCFAHAIATNGVYQASRAPPSRGTAEIDTNGQSPIFGHPPPRAGCAGSRRVLGSASTTDRPARRDPSLVPTSTPGNRRQARRAGHNRTEGNIRACDE